MISNNIQQHDQLPQALEDELRRLDQSAIGALRVPFAVDQAVLQTARARMAWHQRLRILKQIGAAAGGILATASLLVLALRPMALDQPGDKSGDLHPHFLSVQTSEDHRPGNDDGKLTDRPHARPGRQ